jgi:hypothetical protein
MESFFGRFLGGGWTTSSTTLLILMFVNAVPDFGKVKRVDMAGVEGGK